MSKKTEKRVAGDWEYRPQAFQAIAGFTPSGRSRLKAAKEPPSGTTVQFRKRGEMRWQKLNVIGKKPSDTVFSSAENVSTLIEKYLEHKTARDRASRIEIETP